VTAYISGALINAADLERARARYERFAAACRAAGWDAYVPHQHADPVRDPHLSSVDVAQRDLDRIADADALVVYLGEPSLGVGAEVAIALQAGKRILAVAEADRRVSRFLLGLIEMRQGPGAVYRFGAEDEAVAWIEAELGGQTGVRP
jgi:hypothetical protein